MHTERVPTEPTVMAGSRVGTVLCGKTITSFVLTLCRPVLVLSTCWSFRGLFSVSTTRERICPPSVVLRSDSADQHITSGGAKRTRRSARGLGTLSKAATVLFRRRDFSTLRGIRSVVNDGHRTRPLERQRNRGVGRSRGPCVNYRLAATGALGEHF